MNIGAKYLGYGKCEFRVWAPFASTVELEFVSPRPRTISLTKEERGYWSCVAENVPTETSYVYVLDGERKRPDPVSHFQPEGVHGPSRFDHPWSFRWDDDKWNGLELSQYVIYELHVGTFTREGTFHAAIPRLDELRQLGITAIEIMPVAQFPGERNWGYDGAYPFAVQSSYGGPLGLKGFVNECHKRGLAVILDVVYNHLGPEGNYLSDFGPYFTDTYRTPWGRAVNFDGSYSDEVRNYFIQNALYWFELFHIDALRLDAVHAIYDMSARPFLQELAEETEKYSEHMGRKRYLFAESDLNDVRIIRPRELGGFAIDAQWSDDLHHCVHTGLTSESSGYYEDFGEMEQLVKCLREGFVYSGQYSKYRKRRHGNVALDRPGVQFVVCSQNHDQVGNRMLGDRLASLVSFEAQKLAPSIILLSPYIPLLFMGEEYAEEAPFQYFVSHGDEQLIEAVRKGRREEFESFGWTGDVPDPQAEATFLNSKLQWEKRSEGKHQMMLGYYRELLRIRKENAALRQRNKSNLDVFSLEYARVLVMRRWYRKTHVAALFNFSPKDSVLKNPLPPGRWRKILDSSDERWAGPGATLPDQLAGGKSLTMKGHSAALFQKSG